MPLPVPYSQSLHILVKLMTESESLASMPCDSLDHLISAESLEFEIRNEMPGVKSGDCRWTPISIKKKAQSER